MTELRLLVLGLLDRQPRSAYAVGRALGEMPAANFSGSPGAVYPAIKALEREELITRAESDKTTSSDRSFSLTSDGRKVLRQWLEAPIDGWDLVRAPGSVLLRISFLGDEHARRDFRQRIADAAQALLADLGTYSDEAEPDLAGSSSEAIELTSALLRGYLTWARPSRKRDGPAQNVAVDS